MQLQEEYDKWRSAEADAVIAHQFEGELLTKRLNEISNQLRADKRMAAMLDRMAPEVRRTELMRALRREVLKELSLSSLEEWRSTKPQGDLF